MKQRVMYQAVKVSVPYKRTFVKGFFYEAVMRNGQEVMQDESDNIRLSPKEFNYVGCEFKRVEIPVVQFVENRE